jgi:hypothetical protein
MDMPATPAKPAPRSWKTQPGFPAGRAGQGRKAASCHGKDPGLPFPPSASDMETFPCFRVYTWFFGLVKKKFLKTAKKPGFILRVFRA